MEQEKNRGKEAVRLEGVIVGGLYSVAKRRLMTTMIAGIFTMIPSHTVLLPMLVVFLGVGILVGVIGGVTAIRSYLKV